MLIGNSCRLRSYQAEDIQILPTLLGDWNVARWLSSHVPHPYSNADAASWLEMVSEEAPIDNFAIEVDGAYAGGIGLRVHDGDRVGVAELGYWLGRPYWGRGIATEAARLVVSYAFRQRGLRRLEANVVPSNGGSARVLEKCGFVREAVLREALTERDGRITDCVVYAQLASGLISLES